MARAPLMFTGSLKVLFPAGLVGLVYDCDGVMINSAAANRFLYNSILEALSLPPITPAQEKMAFQDTFQHAIEALVPKELHHRLEEAARKAVDYDKDILPRITLMPGYREFVEAAHCHSLRQAIDTNRTELGARKILDLFQLPPYFDPVMSASQVPPKPSSEGAERICGMWGALPGQVLFVGDSPADRSAAKGAGMIFAGFGGLDGDIRVKTWAELEGMLWEEGVS